MSGITMRIPKADGQRFRKKMGLFSSFLHGIHNLSLIFILGRSNIFRWKYSSSFLSDGSDRKLSGLSANSSLPMICMISIFAPERFSLEVDDTIASNPLPLTTYRTAPVSRSRTIVIYCVLPFWRLTKISSMPMTLTSFSLSSLAVFAVNQVDFNLEKQLLLKLRNPLNQQYMRRLKRDIVWTAFLTEKLLSFNPLDNFIRFISIAFVLKSFYPLSMIHQTGRHSFLLIFAETRNIMSSVCV